MVKDRYRQSVERIQKETGMDSETAMTVILLTATLMDLCPWDSEVTEIVISDFKREKACGSTPIRTLAEAKSRTVL